MNKNVIIIGALSLIGVGAFLYFKPKKTKQNIIPSSAGDLVAPSGNSVLPTPTPTPTSTLSEPPTQSNVTIGNVVLTPPVEKLENAIKIAEAKDVARQIYELRNNYETKSQKGTYNDPAFANLFINSPYSYPNRMKALNTSLALLGYTEVNGSIQKI